MAYIVIFSRKRMNATSNSTEVTQETLDAWTESGAMVYVALTVATFSMVMMCCTWLVKLHRKSPSKYNSLDHEDDHEEEIELTSGMSSEEDEDIPLTTHSFDNEHGKEPDPNSFSIDDPESEGDDLDEHEVESEQMTTV